MVTEVIDDGVVHVLARGKKDPCFKDPTGLRCKCMVKGDVTVHCVDAASLIARIR